MYMQELRCDSCFNSFRIEQHNIMPDTAPVRHCPTCGVKPLVMVDPRVDTYWYDLSDSLGFGRSAKGADITHELYRTWHPNEFAKFVDYIDSIRDEIAELIG